MNQYQTERRLTWCYTGLAILLSVSVVCISIAYNHWRQSLDRCPGNWLENVSCGCIFFGATNSQHFSGGHNSYCLFAIFGPLPIIAYAIVMALFHMYRVCINNVGEYEDEKSTTMDEIEGESIVVSSRARVSQHNDAVIYCWIPTSSLSAIFCVYNLVHAGFITHGFHRTCTQYREYLRRILGAVGDHVSAIHFRLSCQSIFDYMDYVHPDPQNSRSGAFINTGAALHIALITSWAAVILWIAVTVYTALRAYKERNVLTCCGN